MAHDEFVLELLNLAERSRSLRDPRRYDGPVAAIVTGKVPRLMISIAAPGANTVELEAGIVTVHGAEQLNGIEVQISV